MFKVNRRSDYLALKDVDFPIWASIKSRGDYGWQVEIYGGHEIGEHVSAIVPEQNEDTAILVASGMLATAISKEIDSFKRGYEAVYAFIHDYAQRKEEGEYA